MVQKYQALVYTVCHQLVPDVQEAQDLTQETFLAAWRAIDRCPPGFEKQWLARIAANKAKDYLRSAWVRKMNTPATRCWAGGRAARYAAGTAGAGSAGRGGAYGDDPEPARALLHAPAVWCCWSSTPWPKLQGCADVRPKRWKRRSTAPKKMMLAQQILQNDRVPCERRSVHGTV